MSLSDVFRPISYKDLPGWPDDNLSAGLDAFVRSAKHAMHSGYRTGELGVDAKVFHSAFAEAEKLVLPVSNTEARLFFERHFLPWRVEPSQGERGFVTGYYEPEAQASMEPSENFSIPVYRRPDDLVPVDSEIALDNAGPQLTFARKAGDRLVPYFDREAIDRGAVAGHGLELCWLADRVDAFFIHIQGAARLNLPDGDVMRITYAAKNGYPFTGIGSVLAQMGEIPPGQVTMQSIRSWLADNPDRLDEILWQNRSYIFFRSTPVGDPDLGPIAAAKVQLQPGRSVAVDRLLHTFGTPFFISAPTLQEFDGQPFRRLMIAQDTGSAITGTARGDLFVGTGPAAGEIAGVVRHSADFYALLPRSLAEAS